MDKQIKVKPKKCYKVVRVIEEYFYTEAKDKEEAEMIARNSCDPYISVLKRVKVSIYNGD